MKIINIEFSNIGKVECQTTQNQISNLRRQLQSSNINVLLGAGFSYAVVGLLGDYESKIQELDSKEDEEEILEMKRNFFRSIILPLIDPEKCKQGEAERIEFLALFGKIIDNRESAILHKIVNIFTTNYDLLIETALEKSYLEYIDGFSGKLQPKFSTSNYGKIINRKSSILDKISEIVTFNIYKVHGSLNWRCENEEIIYNDPLPIIKKLQELADFTFGLTNFGKIYDSELAIINPTNEKFNTTVLNANHYEQLRMYCNELEKNNTVLISFGFSFNDEHIRKMTLRSLKDNPTLTLIIFSFDEEATITYKNFFISNDNVMIIQLIEKVGDETNKILQFTQERINVLLQEISNETE